MKFKLRKNYILHSKDNITYIVPLDDTSKSYKIDGIASLIIGLLEKQTLSEEDIFDRVHSQVPENAHPQLREDINQFIKDSLEKNIIE